MFISVTRSVNCILDRAQGRINRRKLARLTTDQDGRPSNELSAIETALDEASLHEMLFAARKALAHAIAGAELSLYAQFIGKKPQLPDRERTLVPYPDFGLVHKMLNGVRPGPREDWISHRLLRSKLSFNAEEFHNWLDQHLPQLAETALAENKAIEYLAQRLTPDATRKEASDLLAQMGYKFATTGDKSDRVWFASREAAGLPRNGRPGRRRNRGE